MEISEKDLKKFVIIFVMALLAVLTFLLVKPVLFAIISGLILAYICMPLYEKVQSLVRNRNVAASLVSVIVLIIILVPLWFIIPIVIDQIFSIFQSSQAVNVQGFITTLFPGSSDQFVTQLTVTVNTLISKASSYILNGLVNVFLDLPDILIAVFVALATFFGTLKYNKELTEFAAGISPFNKSKEKILVQKFKDVTDSIIYGQLVIGVVQGILAGIGFLIFGVKNALVLTIIAVLLAFVPFIGPWLIWVPISAFMFVSGETSIAIGFIIYNILLVQVAENLLRIYVVARKSEFSSVIAIIGIFGGVFAFGIMGLIIGPLILEYFLTFLQAYKEKTLSSLFSEDETK